MLPIHQFQFHTTGKKEEVEKQLDNDVRMGIIPNTPVEETTKWCLMPINKYCEREPHHTPRPFDIVNNIPPKTYKTTLDAYNGYHKDPLDEESMKLTTFITE